MSDLVYDAIALFCLAWFLADVLYEENLYQDNRLGFRHKKK